MTPGVHAIVSTHTTRHLRRTILGVLAQSRLGGGAPQSVVVSCDTDAPDVAALVEGLASERGAAITLVQRPFQGASRSSQVRNNGVRAILTQDHTPSDILWFLDGDCLPDQDCLGRHLTLCAPHRIVVAFRIDLTPEQTEALDETAIIDRAPIQPTSEQLATLAARDRRYRRHALMRRFGLGKPHKPKLLSANFAVRLDDYLDVNGFDEEYIGYGQEDDDLGRRLYRNGVRPVIGVARAIVYHQWHPTRAPQAWEESPNAERFGRPFAARCVRGVENPLEQPAPGVRRFGVREEANAPGSAGGRA